MDTNTNMSDYVKSIIAANINRLIESRGTSKRAISSELSIPYTTLCDWSKGKTYPRIESLVVLADYFDTEVGEFFIEINKSDELMADRLIKYASLLNEDKAKILDMTIMDNLTEEQVKQLMENGFRFSHRTLEEYIALLGGNFTPSEDISWGEPVGDELW